MFQTGVDRLAMSSIFLMDCLYDSRIFCCILISDLRLRLTKASYYTSLSFFILSVSSSALSTIASIL